MMRRAFLMGCVCLALLTAGAIPVGAARSAAPADSSLLNSLTAYWKLDEASGTRADASGRGNHLSDVNGVAAVGGLSGSAATFARSGSERLSHADNADLSQGDNDFTLAGWFYLNTKPPEIWGSDTASFFTKWSTGDHSEYALLYRPMTVPSYGVTADTFEFLVSSNGTLATTNRAASLSLDGVMTNTWYFIVAWHDSVSNTINIQVNNGPVDSTAFTGGAFDSTSTFDLGWMDANPVGGHLDGRVDELGLWDRELTANERTALYNYGIGLTYPFVAVNYSVRFPILRKDPIPSWVTIKDDGFEGPFPGDWQVVDYGTGGGDYYWGARDCQAASGTRSAWAVGGGNGTLLTCGSHYPNDNESWMVYGPFSLSGALAADLKFKLLLNAEYNYDGLCYAASIDDQHYYGPCVTGYSNGWLDRTLDLANVPGLGDLRGQGNVWIGFTFLSDESITYPGGAFVDNVLLRKCVHEPCTGVGAALQPPLPAAAHLAEKPAALTREGH